MIKSMDDHLSFSLKRFIPQISLDLTKKTMDVTYVEFSPEERELYKAVEERARLHINKYLKGGHRSRELFQYSCNARSSSSGCPMSLS